MRILISLHFISSVKNNFLLVSESFVLYKTFSHNKHMQRIHISLTPLCSCGLESEHNVQQGLDSVCVYQYGSTQTHEMYQIYLTVARNCVGNLLAVMCSSNATKSLSMSTQGHHILTSE